MLKPIQIAALELLLELCKTHPDIFTAEDFYNWSQNLTQLGDESICEEAYRVFTQYAKYINPDLSAKAKNMIDTYFGE